MYKLNVTSEFSAAHRLIGYEGACQNLHGHNWKVRVGIFCEKIDNIGMTIDYGVVKKALSEIINLLDHKYLNEFSSFVTENPTSENIAKFIFGEMQKKMKNEKIADVEVWESDRTSMIYAE